MVKSLGFILSALKSPPQRFLQEKAGSYDCSRSAIVKVGDLSLERFRGRESGVESGEGTTGQQVWKG